MNEDTLQTAWDQTLRTALLGTSRSGKVIDNRFSGLVFHETEPEISVLRNAASLTQLRRASSIQPRVDIKLPESSLLETRRAVGRSAEARFAAMLQGQYSALIGEWLEYAVKTNKRIPFRALPDALDTGAKRKELRQMLSQSIGARGYWLASQNAEWNYLLRVDLSNVPDAPKVEVPAESEIHTLWQTGRHDERIHLLRSLRRQKSPLAIQLIVSTWLDSSAQERAEILETIGHDISPDDEPFLESALDDRSKDVRNFAARLLATLPDSSYARRMTARIRTMTKVTKPLLGSVRVEIDPPDECDKEMQRDGIEPKPKDVTGYGQQAWILYRIAGLASPKVWGEQLGRKIEPEEFLKATEQSRWRKQLLTGLSESAVRFQDQEWLLALLHAKDNIADRGKLLMALSRENRNAYFEHHFDKIGDNLSEYEELSAQLVNGPAYSWSVTLSRHVLQLLRGIVASPQAVPRFYYWTSLFNLAGHCIPPQLCQEAMLAWPDSSAVYRTWQSAVDKMLDTLQFRADMIQEIEHE